LRSWPACDLEAVPVLVPHLAGLAIERVSASGTTVRVLARTRTGEAACSGCGAVSRRVHSSYRRHLADTASGGQEVVIDLQVRRFFCDSGCGKKTFAEQVPGLTARYGRRTLGLETVLVAVALALSGRAGARLAGRLACAVSRSTLIRLVRAAADPDGQVTLVLGVDDFALRKGHVYGTMVTSHRVARRPPDISVDPRERRPARRPLSRTITERRQTGTARGYFRPRARRRRPRERRRRPRLSGGVDPPQLSGELASVAAGEGPQAVADEVHVMPTSA
jgi:transposase